MAKKNATRRTTTRNPEGAENTRFELRFDNAVYEGIRTFSERAGVSINRLMQGLARWGIGALKVGEPQRDQNGWITE